VDLAGGRRVPGEGPARQKGGAGEAEATGANPTDRAKCGTKRHLLPDRLDAPLLELPADLAHAVRHLCLDLGYDDAECREAAATRGDTGHLPPPRDAPRPAPPPGDPPRHPARRWVVEAGHGWFDRFRRPLVRWEKKAQNYLGLVQLAACLIVYRKLRHARAPFG
jgi:transposase